MTTKLRFTAGRLHADLVPPEYVTSHAPQAAFVGLVNLLSESLGAEALATSDDFFAGMENLVKDSPAIFLPDEYTDRGKWMDGWESRRKRVSGNDWCILRLGVPGEIRGVDIDTAHFLGNQPPFAILEATSFEGQGLPPENAKWTTIVSQAPLRPGSQNLFVSESADIFTHVKLTLFPDGGVARLRLFGNAAPRWDAKAPEGTPVQDGEVDLAALAHGGRALACSDAFFGPMNNLIAPGRAVNMGGGWETRRRVGRPYDDRPDWILVELGARGSIGLLELDTNHFKGNFPDRCSVEAIDLPGASITDVLESNDWFTLLDEQKMRASERHFFRAELLSDAPCTHVRLFVHPDGGVSRLRAFGTRA